MKEFNQIYQEIYQNVNKELKKVKYEKLVVQLIFVALIIGCIALMNFNRLFGFLAIAVCIWLVCSILEQVTKYKKVYKNKVIKEFIKNYSEDLHYYPEQGMNASVYNQSGFEASYDRYVSDDFIAGTISEDYKVQMAEVHTQKEEITEDSEGRSRTCYVTLFHGIFLEVELPKSIKFEIRISQNTFLSDVFKEKNKLDMDSGTFEKIYDVKTNDRIQAMRILTADVMQMLIEFKEENKFVPEIIIKQNKIYVRYMTGTVFEPSIIGNDMNFEKLKKYYNIIRFTITLAAELTKNMIEFDE